MRCNPSSSKSEYPGLQLREAPLSIAKDCELERNMPMQVARRFETSTPEYRDMNGEAYHGVASEAPMGCG